MRPAVAFLIAALILGFASVGVTFTTAYPRYLSSVGDAIVWSVFTSAPFLLAAVVASLAMRWRRNSSLGTPLTVVIVLLLVLGVPWAFLYNVALGL